MACYWMNIGYVLVLVSLHSFVAVDAQVQKVPESTDLFLHRDTRTWSEAFTECQHLHGNGSGSLAVLSDTELHFAKDVLKGTGSTAWISQYRDTTNWLVATGCYKNQHTNFTNLADNTIPGCKRLCGDSDILLNVKNCSCIHGSPDKTDLIDLIQCTTPCPGNSDSVCGGPEHFLYYTTYTTQMYSTGDGMCGMYERTGVTTGVHVRRCSSSYIPVCMRYVNKNNRMAVWTPRDNAGHLPFVAYDKATQICRDNGYLLANPGVLQYRHDYYQHKNDSTQYWVGVRKWTQLVHPLEEIPLFGDEDTCSFVTGSDVVPPDATQDCQNKIWYICRNGSDKTLRTSDISSISPGMPSSTSKSTSGDISTTSMNTRTSPKLVNTDALPRTTIATALTSTTVPTDVSTPTSASSPDTNQPPLQAMYIGIGVVLLIVILVCLLIVIRRRRHSTRKPRRDGIPLEGYNHDYTYILIPENGSGSTVREQGGGHALSSVAYSDVLPDDSNTSSGLYHLANNTDQECTQVNKYELDKANTVLKPMPGNSTNDDRRSDDTRAQPLADDVYNVLRETPVHEDKDTIYDHASGGNDTYVVVDLGVNKTKGDNDDVYDHASHFLDEGHYHELPTLGHKHQEDEYNAYDSMGGVVDSDIYSCLSHQGAEVRDIEPHNPYR